MFMCIAYVLFIVYVLRITDVLLSLLKIPDVSLSSPNMIVVVIVIVIVIVVIVIVKVIVIAKGVICVCK